MYTDMYEKIDIYNLTFIKDIKDILNQQAAPYSIKSETEIDGLIKHFTELSNVFYLKYKAILNCSNTAMLNAKIAKLNYDERLDLCAFFKIRFHFSKNLSPSIRNFCKTLGLKTLNSDNLVKTLLDREVILDNSLSFPYKIPCTNCNHPIDTTIIYKGAESYNTEHLECSICNHTFYFQVSNTNRYTTYGDSLITSRFVKMTYCNCPSCTAWRNKLMNYISSNYEEFKNELFNYILSLNSNTPNTTKRLEKLFEIYRNSLTKIEKEILNSNPKNFSDIENLLYNIGNPDFSDSYINEAIDNLLKHGIIYSTPNTTNILRDINAYISQFVTLVQLIEQGNLSRLCEGHMGTQYPQTLMPFTIEYNYKDQSQDTIRKDIHLNYITIAGINKYELTPYYFNGINNAQTYLSIKKYMIFDSNDKLILFNDLKLRYKNCIITTNFSLTPLIDDSLTTIEKHFNADDINWLKGCSINFVISDSNGYILKCIELRKDSNHNEPEWIKKDFLKRKLLNLLCIPLEEEFLY